MHKSVKRLISVSDVIRTKSISLENTRGNENEIVLEIGREEQRYSLHLGVERGLEDNYKGLTFGKFNEETLEEIIGLFERFLAQKTDASISETFEVMIMEDDSLHDKPKWDKKGYAKISFHEKNGQNSLRIELSRYRGTAPSVSAYIGDDKELVKDLMQFLRDSMKSPLNIEKPKSIPNEIENAGKRLEMGIEKFYMGDEVGAIKEAREAFHVVDKKEGWLKDKISEEKANDLLASRKQLEGLGLHEEHREETTTPEDAELVLRDIANMLNFIVDST